MSPSHSPSPSERNVDLSTENAGLKIHPNFYIGAALALTALLSFEVGKGVGLKEGRALDEASGRVELGAESKDIDLKP